jgi:hypothetical protein
VLRKRAGQREVKYHEAGEPRNEKGYDLYSMLVIIGMIKDEVRLLIQVSTETLLGTNENM